ncbi:BRISC complex subunit Abraxas 2-like [Pecten maximus]|uniref:BRISC complex subunit Abraxas 2-like n=1 Tax=Pecten maximus TaxID=6579 RepID=UPI001458916D|nr:BRISC complex subunit Abraxas 2-like [Pecten maximus]
MAAIISGPVLASLFYDQTRCSGDQEGLLIGKVSHSVKDTISDSQINNYKVETKLYVYSCHELQRETNISRKEQLQKCITEQIKRHGEKCIVGWYHSRRNTASRLSMRERSVHQTLLKSLPSQGREDFYFLLCTSSNTPNRSTHNFDFGFYKLNKDDADLTKVPVTIANLEDTTTNLYKLDSSCTASASSGIYASVISQFQPEILDKSGQVQEVKKISSLGSSLQEKLQDLTRGVDQTERQLHALELEVKERRQMMELKLEKERNNKAHSNTPPPAYDHTPIQIGNTNASSDDAISIAKQKREQRRRDTSKSLHPNMSSGRPSSAKTKADQVHPLTRRLSSELDEPTPTHSRRLSDDIAFIDEDVPEVTEHEEMDTKSDDEMKSRESDIQEHTQEHVQGSEVISLPHKGQTVRLTLPEMNVPEASKQTIPSVTLEHQTNSYSGNKDHFSFVSGLLAEEKTKPVKNKVAENSYKHSNSMSVPIGGQMTAPQKSSKAAAAVGAAVAAAAVNNKDEESTRQSSRLQKQQLTSSAVLNVSNKGQRSRTKQGQHQPARSRSKEGTKAKETSGVNLDHPSSKDKRSKNNVINRDQDSQNSSAVCRLEANDEQTQNFEEEETEDIHTINDHGQLDNFKISSSPVF